MSDVIAIKAVNLTKVYADSTKALDNINLEFKEGSFTAILGPAGSGKTTLSNLIGCLDTPTGGWVEVFGRRVHTMISPNIFRAKEIGFIFRDDMLFPVLSVIDNVLIPSRALPSSKARAIKRANELLALVGLQNKKHLLPQKLTTGEKRLAALARALVNDPRIVLADEPTSTIDGESGDMVLDIIRKVNNETYTTFIVTTKNVAVANKADKIVTLNHGRMQNVSKTNK